jgi:hypothetical protein
LGSGTVQSGITERALMELVAKDCNPALDE